MIVLLAVVNLGIQYSNTPIFVDCWGAQKLIIIMDPKDFENEKWTKWQKSVSLYKYFWLLSNKLSNTSYFPILLFAYLLCMQWFFLHCYCIKLIFRKSFFRITLHFYIYFSLQKGRAFEEGDTLTAFMDFFSQRPNSPGQDLNGRHFR